MNDDFLYKFRKPPQQEFANRLYAKISKRSDTVFARNAPLLKRFALGLVVLCIAFVLTLVVSPNARAHIEEIVRQIGSLIIHETSRIVDYDQDALEIPEQIVNLSDARDILPFSFDLPTWAPEGFVLREEHVFVGVLQQPLPISRVIVEWENVAVCKESPELCEQSEASDPRRAFLPTIVLVAIYSQDQDLGEKIRAGIGSVEEVSIAGEPAALIRGGWDKETGEFVQNDALFLFWESGEVLYYLQGLARDISPDDLIRMAESMP